MTDREEGNMDLAPVDLVSHSLPVAALADQVRYVDELFARVLKRDVDYGKVPGMPQNAKPALFQAGAQMLCRGLQLCPRYTVMSVSRTPQTVAYVITCELTHYSSNRVVGTGLGACNTQEKKYAKTLRTLADRAAQYNDPMPTAMELENTVLKMAKKRALVDAVLNATAASRVFSSTSADEDDTPHGEPEPQPQPAKKMATGNPQSGPVAVPIGSSGAPRRGPRPVPVRQPEIVPTAPVEAREPGDEDEDQAAFEAAAKGEVQ